MLNMNVKWQVMYMPAELHARPVSSHARCLNYFLLHKAHVT